MVVTLRSGRELEGGRVEQKDTEKKKHAEIGEEIKNRDSKTDEEDKTANMQQE